VTVGKRLTGTGKIRRFFATQTEANNFIADALAAARERGHFAFAIPHKLAIEALEAVKLLQPHGASLMEVVKGWLKEREARTQPSLSSLTPVYLQTKANPEYRRAQQIALRVFEEQFGNTPITAICANKIELWLEQKNWNPLNRRNYLRDVSMFFGWAKRHQYIAENPCDRIKRPKVHRTIPTIYSFAETESLLTAALVHEELGLLAMYVIGFFAGVRVRELMRMTWQMIDWEEGEIRLPPHVTKTGNPRNIDICDSLRAWLFPRRQAAGPIVSAINLRLRRLELHKLANVPLRQNAIRHTFASNHAAHHRDPGGLQLQLGQETPSVLFRHYLTAIRKTEAAAYFRSRPGDGVNVAPVSVVESDDKVAA
jgi:integrase